jgi:hypothetical protein
MNSVLVVLSMSCRIFSLVADRFTFVSGKICYLILFAPGRKVHKRGKLEIFNCL